MPMHAPVIVAVFLFDLTIAGAVIVHWWRSGK